MDRIEDIEKAILKSLFGLLICSIFLIIFVELQIEGIILSLFAGYISMEVVFDIFMNNDLSLIHM